MGFGTFVLLFEHASVHATASITATRDCFDDYLTETGCAVEFGTAMALSIVDGPNQASMRLGNRPDDTLRPMRASHLAGIRWDGPAGMPPSPEFTPAERRLIARLRTPEQVQRWLNRLPYNWERRGETLRTLRGVLRHGRAHCLEAALAAATILEQHGHPPLLLDGVGAASAPWRARAIPASTDAGRSIERCAAWSRATRRPTSIRAGGCGATGCST